MEGRASVLVPFSIGRSERIEVSTRLPGASEIPAGFRYIPAGRFLFGSSDEALRADFLDTVPIHPRSTKSFLVSEREVTLAEWIDFLNEQPRSRLKSLLPSGRDPSGGLVSLTPTGPNTWRYKFNGWSAESTAVAGQKLRYQGRPPGSEQEWRQFPVTGVSPEAIERFIEWTRESGRVKGARLCTELEWERAARGSDGRSFPHGERLQPEDANFDEAYGKQPISFGLDAVESHRRSVSPFGLYDMAGNAWDLVRSSLGDSGYVARGGCYYQAAKAARADNRAIVDDHIRAQSIGFRLCADTNDGSEQ
jgi:formylglycine-generating enzyme required for sulfatase activity